MREKRAADDDGDVRLLPIKKRGRPVLWLIQKSSSILEELGEEEVFFSSRIAMAAARGILLSRNRSRLVNFGGGVGAEQAMGLLTPEAHEVCQAKGHNSQEQALSSWLHASETAIFSESTTSISLQLCFAALSPEISYQFRWSTKKKNRPLSYTPSVPIQLEITHSPNHRSNEQTMVQYVENIIIPQLDVRLLKMILQHWSSWTTSKARSPVK